MNITYREAGGRGNRGQGRAEEVREERKSRGKTQEGL